MGFKRNVGQAALGILLLVSSAAAIAGSGEPLVITRLSDPETELVVVSGEAEESSADQQIRTFAQAINQAATAERQAVAASCRSVRSIPVAGAGREAWEANCRYQRH
jgi:hypothetical protein